MVVICLPTASLTTIPQERTATPSMWTVQAPHCAMPQPYLVPVRPTHSRIAHNSGVLGSMSTSCAVPLMVRRAIPILPDQVAPEADAHILARGRITYASRGDHPPGSMRTLWRHPIPISLPEKSRISDVRRGLPLPACGERVGV